MSIVTDHVAVNARLRAQWRAPDLARRNAAHWQRRLAVIVPYRDRAAHLQTFVVHLQNYFRHDKLDRQIPCAVHIVEQADTRPFNRGALLNAGFKLAADEADYVCLHDVDLLPIWADYAWPEHPARLCMFGLSTPQLRHWCLGGVTAVSVTDYRALNGFSNDYWGWGYEDFDFRLRTLAVGLSMEARDGLFSELSHQRNGVSADGGESGAGRRNRERLEDRHARGFREWPHEGLNSLHFDHLDSHPITLEGVPPDWVKLHRIALAG